MATRSIPTDDGVVAIADAMGCGINKEDAGERIRRALNGIEAINSVVQSNGDEPDTDCWSKPFTDMLQDGLCVLVQSIRTDLGAMQAELWRVHALHGDYGPDMLARAQRAAAASAAAGEG